MSSNLLVLLLSSLLFRCCFCSNAAMVFSHMNATEALRSWSRQHQNTNGTRPEKVWELCEKWNSGKWNDKALTWTEPANRLFPLLENKNVYNRYLAPGQVYGAPTNISLAVYIESITSFKAQTMDFDVDMYLAMSWYDLRLMHNCNHPILIQHLETSRALWNPDLYFVNSKFAHFTVVTTPNFMMMVYPDGMVFKSLRVYVTLSCSLDLVFYPMDTQRCPFVMQSYAYVDSVVHLRWHIDEAAGFPISNNPGIMLNDMKIVEKNYSYCSSEYDMLRATSRWSCLTAEIVMKRLLMFHVIQTYIPTGMLVVISWLSFWLDARAAPARIGLSITSLLTLTTMGNGARSDLPQVSYIKAMDVWLSCCTIFVFSVLVEYTTVSYFLSKQMFKCRHLAQSSRYCHYLKLAGRKLIQSAEEMPIDEFEKEKKQCDICKFNSERVAKLIDKIARVVYPILFVLATFSYWIYYLHDGLPNLF